MRPHFGRRMNALLCENALIHAWGLGLIRGCGLSQPASKPVSKPASQPYPIWLKMLFSLFVALLVAVLMEATRARRTSSSRSTQQRKEKPKSLSEWLRQSEFLANSINKDFAGTRPKQFLEKLRRIRKEASGPGGLMSRGHRRVHAALLVPGEGDVNCSHVSKSKHSSAA